MTALEIWVLAMAAFLITVILVLWRPFGIHEAIPALLGAFLMFLVGLIDRADVLRVMGVVWNSAMTIIATFVMAMTLQRSGFFEWVGDRLIERSGGSGHRLFHLVLAFSACLTLFLNNDGSILLGTPIILGLVGRLNLPKRAAFGYLLGACLVASASSPPVGVSNMANLEAMNLVGVSLTQHLEVIFTPAVIGLTSCWLLLYGVFFRSLPSQIDQNGKPEAGWLPRVLPHPHAVQRPHTPPPPPHDGPPPAPPRHRHPVNLYAGPPSHHRRRPDYPFMWFAVGVVVAVRLGFFLASLVSIPTYAVAVAGAAVLVAASYLRGHRGIRHTIRTAPWPILGFALGMDLIVFGLRHAGLIGVTAGWIDAVHTSPLAASTLPGLLTTGVSALLNNHPGLIIGSLSLLEVPGLVGIPFHTAYASVVLGSDLGSLVTPAGTLASLLWFHILQQNGQRHSWWDYARVTCVVIPISFGLALAGLYCETVFFRLR